MDVHLPLTSELITRCLEELKKHKRQEENNSAPCLEIYYRAFHEDDEEAVNHVCESIGKMAQGQLDATVIFNEIKTRPGRLAYFKENFQEYPRFKSWFRLKVASTIRNVRRREEPHDNEMDIDEITGNDHPAYVPDFDGDILVEELFNLFGEVLLPDDIELLKLRYVKDMKPSEISAGYSQQYPTARDVSVRLYNMLTQIRGNQDLLYELKVYIQGEDDAEI